MRCSRTEARITIDPDEAFERDELAAAKRLLTIAEVLAEGVRRQRKDLRRMGEFGQHPETESPIDSNRSNRIALIGTLSLLTNRPVREQDLNRRRSWICLKQLLAL